MLKRKYTAADLEDLPRAELVKIVKAQKQLWPHFDRHRPSAAKIKERILADDSPFLKDATPVPDSNRSLSGSQLSSLSQTPERELTQAIQGKRVETPGDLSGIEESHSIELEEIKVYIYNMADSSTLRQRVRVPIQKEGGDGEKELRVDSLEVLNALQNTTAKFFGNVRFMVLVSDNKNPFGGELYEFFAVLEASEFKLAIGSDTYLRLDSEYQLAIKVEALDVSAGELTSSEPKALFDEDYHASGMKPLEYARKIAPERKRQRIESKNEKDQQLLTWLREEIKRRDGYEEFAAAKELANSRKLQNPDIEDYWTFGATCVEDLAKTTCASVDNWKVNKWHIHEALDLPASWFTAARKGVELISIYGPNGPFKASKVVSELERRSDKPGGWTGLLKFLKNHHKKAKKARQKKNVK
ncbi:hypothetical protein D9758_000953 [Tetrapyrgos nigripes]|uniref:Uncharacterized protein n=1 Tax=Tetrapyrgos nigripes TaxID=182062 RepID=A0A8H5GZ82_9AGAR|nr:hypothetical protein D9758_000953 [Tetrapyrgos nigripes]